MKRYLIAFLFSSLVSLASTTAHADEEVYRIQVCTIALNKLAIEGVSTNVPDQFQHMYLRGVADGNFDNFHFEPFPENTIYSRASIGKLDYEGAICEDVFITESKETYQYNIELVHDHYEKSASKSFTILDTTSQTVTEKLLRKLKLSLPEKTNALVTSQRIITDNYFKSAKEYWPNDNIYINCSLF